MTNWTAGYVAEIGYTFGYYAELNPQRLVLPFLTEGLVCPEVKNACELGFGQGVSINTHAAASVTCWHGTDFNPTQAGFAQAVAKQSGAKVELFDEAFDAFCQREDLPEFDFIGLHGIWSWISDENRAVIVEFIRRKLRVGGVLYISYNTQPGWAAMVPMRELLTTHTEVMGASGQGIVPKIDAALEFAEKLIATKPGYFNVNPNVVERMNRIQKQDRHYLAHEYFNKDWSPMTFARMAEWLAPAKMDFACSASYIDQIDAINLTKEQQGLLAELPNQVFRETVRDFMVNQQFRRDYWVKGARRLNAFDRAAAIRQLRVMLIAPRESVPMKVTGALGEANFAETVYNPILDALTKSETPTVAQIENALGNTSVGFGQLVQALLILAGTGYVALVQDDDTIANAQVQTDRLNAVLIDQARGSNDVNFLASPVTGGAITVGRFQKLFLLAMDQGKQGEEELAAFVWQILSAQGQLLVKDGVNLSTPEANIAELQAQAKVFLETSLSIFKLLKVV